MKRFLLPFAGILLGLVIGILIIQPREPDANVEDGGRKSPGISTTRRVDRDLPSFINQRLPEPDGSRAVWYTTERKRLREQTGSPYRYSALLGHAIENLSGEQLADMLKAGAFDSTEETTRAFARLAEIDPLWAMQVREQTPLGIDEMGACIAAVYSVWVRSDPVKALDWSYHFPSSGGRQQHSLTLTDEWLKVDPAGVAAHFDRLQHARGYGSFSAGFEDKLMRAWTSKDIDAAEAWLGTLPAGDKKNNLSAAFAAAAAGK